MVSESPVGQFAGARVGQPAVVFFDRALFAVVVAGEGDSVSPLDGSVAPVGRWRRARGFSALPEEVHPRWVPSSRG
ncbi:hypothetical protein BST12_26095 [Mycobacterium angelicum]|uniref:Uncharacterized protein n=1 Tax=Mycobacterium angelicum TaxID=470074 RepID=A0A1W9ZBR0_MYCAN|nr:hypothetical protein BST12_26095 [Mycobacterium angelicum]